MGGGRANTDFRRAPRAETIAMPDIEVRETGNVVGASAADAYLGMLCVWRRRRGDVGNEEWTARERAGERR